MIRPAYSTADATAAPGTDTRSRATGAPPGTPGAPARRDLRGARRRRAVHWTLRSALPLTAILALAGFLRFWQLTATGFNSDEAVYTGTAASLGGDPGMQALFPVFRAHPVLFTGLLSLFLRGGTDDFTARAVAAAIGVATVAVTYLLARRLYGRAAGLAAALLLAVMPYHVVVTRQVLLDGLMTLCATVALYCVVRYVQGGLDGLPWLIGAAGALGAATLSKETALVLVCGLYVFFVLSRSVRMRLRHAVLATGVLCLVVAAFPLATSLAGHRSTGQNYLQWQLLRRANHSMGFYAVTVPQAVGWATLVAAAAGLVLLRRRTDWREGLLLCWIAAPVLYFTLWPVKGFPYLLPIAPALAVLAGRALSALAELRLRPGRLRSGRLRRGRLRLRPGVLSAVGAVLVALAVAASLALSSASRITAAPNGSFLAGSGGLPGGREAGRWVHDHVPVGAQLLAAGPSTANVLQFYGGKSVSALSVSVNRLHRNPSYTPVPNPDRSLRDGEFQYLVWDSYTAHRAPFYGAKIRQLVEKYHGTAVYASALRVPTSSADPTPTPVIVIYQVRVS
ncbi:glycosyltransferase family 39 protein [Streptomyces sp. TLI_105]|uniref:ArnT family glycosyltransferase n=1 Tax=Streptomyces sp. TLI_105 TaxID=1881019 RepID=UPI00089B8117|nr:glycosyltransferase family 39 protein [Streptomyces sp. TLI_105]SED89486.1 Dolichyl-phosphate-mannose-protein mannosyltransferase [Streptomyces sp. TLI_105]